MFCDQAKEDLSQKGIKFQERDIAQDRGALAELKKLGYMTTPVIVIDGSAHLHCGKVCEAGNDVIGFKKPVAGACRLQFVISQNLEGQMKAPVNLGLSILPFG